MDISKINDLRQEGKRIFERYGVDNMPPAVADRLQAINAELEAACKASDAESARKRFNDIERAMNTPAGQMQHPGRSGGGEGVGLSLLSSKAIGAAFVGSKAFREFDGHSSPVAEIELKTLLDTTGWAAESVRLARVEPYPVAALGVADLFAQGDTSQATVPYMEETTYTNTAAEVAEGGEKPEATLAFTERTATVRTIAVFLPVSRQLMDDVSAARSYVGSRLALMVRSRLDSELLNGDGVAPNLLGILNTPNVQTQAKGADPVPDALLKALTLVEVNAGYACDGVCLNPADWRDLRLLRTADGQYIFGHPSAVTPPQVWGLPVATSARLAEGTGLVGSFKGAAQLFYRSAMEIAVSDSHSDYFVKNKLAVRAEIRLTLACFRASAFCTVTGI